VRQFLPPPDLGAAGVAAAPTRHPVILAKFPTQGRDWIAFPICWPRRRADAALAIAKAPLGVPACPRVQAITPLASLSLRHRPP